MLEWLIILRVLAVNLDEIVENDAYDDTYLVLFNMQVVDDEVDELLEYDEIEQQLDVQTGDAGNDEIDDYENADIDDEVEVECQFPRQIQQVMVENDAVDDEIDEHIIIIILIDVQLLNIDDDDEEVDVIIAKVYDELDVNELYLYAI